MGEGWGRRGRRKGKVGLHALVTARFLRGLVYRRFSIIKFEILVRNVCQPLNQDGLRLKTVTVILPICKPFDLI